MKRIGILAGMGPRSTSPFLEMLLDEAQQHDALYDADYPHILIYSLPTPFYPDREVDHHAMKAALSVGINSLVAGGIDLLTIPCNTVHKYFEYITSQAKNIPVLNIIDETVKKINSNIKCVALLATRATIESKLYQEKIGEKNIAFYHIEELQQQIDQLLLVLKKEKFSVAATIIWNNIVVSITKAGCSSVIIACTDITLCLSEADQCQNAKINFINSAKVLAKATFIRYQQLS